MPVPMAKRAAARDDAKNDSAKRQRQDAADVHIIVSHPNGVKPAGNALLAHADHVATHMGLFSTLPHTLILQILGYLPVQDLAMLQGVNHAFRAFALHEPLWREALISMTAGRLKHWKGSWRSTAIAHLNQGHTLYANVLSKTVFSDELFLPLQLLSTPLHPYTPKEGNHSFRGIERVRSDEISKASFLERFAIPNKPCLLVDSCNDTELPTWTLADLEDMYGTRRIRAEALTMSMKTYHAYAKSCESQGHRNWIADESPFYLFDPTLARSMQKENRFVVPRLFREDKVNNNKGLMTKDWDLFSLLQDQRPDNAWVIAGPVRSGSGWHVDPNHTSAYNTVLSGTKLWLLLPPHITPPGVYISQDGGTVTAPLSIIEWLTDFWKPCVRKHGSRGDDTLLVDVCRPGETIYVPAGWKHLVINLEESVAFTQNFVSPAELPSVLDFLKNRPDQISGFRVKRKHSETITEDSDESEPELDELENDGINEKSKLFDLFETRLRQFDADLHRKGVEGLAQLEANRKTSSAVHTNRTLSTGQSWWQALKSSGDGKASSDIESQRKEGLFSEHLAPDDILDEVPW